MKNLYASGDYLLLGKEAHKAKSSLLIVGMNDLSAAMKAFQLKTLEGSDTDSYPGYIQMFEEQCLAAVEELKQVLAELEPGSASE
ncbi:MAG: hypothetical protein LWW85_09040 [Marinilabiliales bacterium]|nr:hypothetical protein [Marinilabiliales bacterium]